MKVPSRPKIYHIAHLDRLPSILADGHLWCDAEMTQRSPSGTVIGMNKIKQRRRTKSLASHPDSHVGDCVPFYFCPRSIMLYLLWQKNDPELTSLEGQDPIIHLEADLYDAVAWADQNERRWAFALSNAGTLYFEDRADLAKLGEINWDAVQTHRWSGQGISPTIKEGKQAEFLIERCFPWKLFERIGVLSPSYSAVLGALPTNSPRPQVEIRPEWYY